MVIQTSSSAQLLYFYWKASALKGAFHQNAQGAEGVLGPVGPGMKIGVLMRLALQYMYSASVFLGVLVTSYFMLSQGDSADPFRAMMASPVALQSTFSPKTETAVSNLFSLQDMMEAMPEEKTPEVADPEVSPRATASSGLMQTSSARPKRIQVDIIYRKTRDVRR